MLAIAANDGRGQCAVDSVDGFPTPDYSTVPAVLEAL
jgi:hypothetical protein